MIGCLNGAGCLDETHGFGCVVAAAVVKGVFVVVFFFITTSRSLLVFAVLPSATPEREELILPSLICI